MKTLEELRAAEQAAVESLRAAIDAIDSTTAETSKEDLDKLTADFDEAKRAHESATAERERREQIDGVRRSLPPPEKAEEIREPSREPRSAPEARVKSEEPEYRPDGDNSFFHDLRSARNGNSEAAERLRRSQAQVIDHYRREGRAHELRDVTTGSNEGAGIIPPVYLGNMLIDIRRERRPAANIFPAMPMPPTGMTITMPRIDSGASVAVQNPEGSALSETDIDSSQLSVDIRTIGGLQDMTVQLWERSDPGMDQIIAAELFALYDQRLDVQVLEGSGSSGQIPGLTTVSNTNAVTYTDGSPTGAALLPKIYDAIQQVWTGYFAPATHILMHPRRAAWLASDSSSDHPIVQQGGFSNGFGSQDGGFVLSLAGLPVVTDANIVTTDGDGTNQDEIYVVAAPASPLAEGALRFDVHDQPLGDQLKVRARAWNYVAFASERYPASISVISGTGLVEPSF